MSNIKKKDICNCNQKNCYICGSFKKLEHESNTI